MTDKRGSVPLLVAGVVPAILLAGFYAANATASMMARARLQAATDAGALIAARDLSKDAAVRDKNVRAVIKSNYNSNLPAGATPLADADITITQVGNDKVEVGASVAVASPLKKLTTYYGKGDWSSATVAGNSAAVRTTTGIELALVLDTTLSMAFDDGTTDPDGHKYARIEYARKAALALLGTLFGSKTDYQQNLYVSVVPFNVAINIGNGATQQGWLTGTPPAYPSGHSWSGCVEARPNGYDTREDAPSSGTADSMFRKYFWPSTYDASLVSTNTAPKGKASNASCTANQDYSNGVCYGNNDWTAPDPLQSANPLVAASNDFNGYYGVLATGSRVSTGSGRVLGPNFMCPTVPVLPLTMDRATIEGAINKTVGTSTAPYPFSYGTVIAAGLQGAWFTLSPQWRDKWGNPNPVRADGTRLTPPSALPLDYNTPRMKKVVVLLSDGDNNWFNARDPLSLDNKTVKGANNILPRPESVRSEMFYNAYGILSKSSNRLGITIPNAANPPAANSTQLESDYTALRANADAKLDAITKQLCANMKAQGIVIYAVGLGIPSDDTNAKDLLSGCVTPKTNPNDANEKSKFINTTKASDLIAAFTQVANELAELRLVR